MSLERFFTNEELVAMVKQKNDDAFKILLTRFSKFIFFKCNCFYTDSLQIDITDLIQECEIALYGAALSFKPELGFQFTTYFKSVLSITIKRELQKAHKKREKMLKHEHQDSSLVCLSQKPSKKIEESPEGYIMLKETQKELYEHIEKYLSYLEKTCLMLYAKGLSYEEIAKKMGISKKSVDGALFRARKKLSVYIDIDEYFKFK